MERKIKVFIVEDHVMFRSGLRVLLGKSDKIEIVAEAENGRIFIENFEKNMPDVVLMDIRMPVMDGIEASQLALAKCPELKILCLSMFGDEEYYYKMLNAGVKGFVLKSSGINELEKAIVEISKNSSYFSPELLQHVIVNISENKPSQEIPILSQEELMVLNGICKNQSNDDIAMLTKLSINEVKTITNLLHTKTNSLSSSGLVLYAIKNKLFSI